MQTLNQNEVSAINGALMNLNAALDALAEADVRTPAMWSIGRAAQELKTSLGAPPLPDMTGSRRPAEPVMSIAECLKYEATKPKPGFLQNISSALGF